MSSATESPVGQTSRLAVSTGSLYDLDIPTEEAIGVLADRGIGSVEVYLQCPPELDPQFVRDLASRCAWHGVTVTSVHPYVFGFESQLYSGYRRQRSWAWGTFDRYVDITAQLGAAHCVMHGPPRHLVTEEGRLTSAYVDDTLALAARAREHGVTYGIENVSYGLIQTVEEARMHIEATGGAVPLVLDVKSAWKRGQKPSSFAAEVGDSVAFTHLSFRSGPDGPFGVCLPPSGDEPDLREMFRVFDEAGTMPPVHVVEVFWPRSVDDVVAAVEAVQREMAASVVRVSERRSSASRALPTGDGASSLPNLTQ